MNIQAAYNKWAEQYDSNANKTRDLEAISLRETLADIPFDNCLEIGCGTGKNTEWLLTKAKEIVAVDQSVEMLKKAKEKIVSNKVIFIQADINKEWGFTTKKFDLIVFSLVLEHIENLDPIFKNCAATVATGGYMYIGELHPFKQYTGSKAKFDTADGQQIVTCFDHHLSDFTLLAVKYGFCIQVVKEYFDEHDRKNIPRILTLLLIKQ